ncbi:MAG: circadian clock protein KaiC [Methanomassiliicoccales archaeon]|nr:MAG: circadian clock protein KaiC [Methanomassiliicoccales archaeon]
MRNAMAAARILFEKRCPSGIEDLDKIIGGGFPLGGTVNVAGGCGCGKTTLAVEFLVRGALMGEKGVYIATTCSPLKAFKGTVRLCVFDDRMIDDKTIRLVDIEDIMGKVPQPRRPLGRNAALDLLNAIENIIVKNGAKRLVIDPITPMLMDMEPGVERDFMKVLNDSMSKKECTTVIVSSGPEDAIGPLSADGRILMEDFERDGDFIRVLQVQKMAGAQHSRARYAFDITSCGILMTPLMKGSGQ